MSTASIQAPPLFDFRVVIEQDVNGAYSAECLQTGAVATADDYDTVLSIIEEVLASEARLALDSGNFANLFSSPAAPGTWYKWAEYAARQEPVIRFITIEPTTPGPELSNIPKKPAVSTKIEVARSAGQNSRTVIG